MESLVLSSSGDDPQPGGAGEQAMNRDDRRCTDSTIFHGLTRPMRTRLVQDGGTHDCLQGADGEKPRTRRFDCSNEISTTGRNFSLSAIRKRIGIGGSEDRGCLGFLRMLQTRALQLARSDPLATPHRKRARVQGSGFRLRFIRFRSTGASTPPVKTKPTPIHPFCCLGCGVTAVRRLMIMDYHQY